MVANTCPPNNKIALVWSDSVRLPNFVTMFNSRTYAYCQQCSTLLDQGKSKWWPVNRKYELETGDNRKMYAAICQYFRMRPTQSSHCQHVLADIGRQPDVKVVAFKPKYTLSQDCVEISKKFCGYLYTVVTMTNSIVTLPSFSDISNFKFMFSAEWMTTLFVPERAEQWNTKALLHRQNWPAYIKNASNI